MKLKNRDGSRGNGIAIGLSALAVVLAATGTAAAAVTSGTFSLHDHTHPSYYLKVDSAGRIATTGTAATNSGAIADHTHPGQYLKVDSSGRLTTTVQTATVNVSANTFMTSNIDNFVVTPTTAQFAVTHVGASALPTNTGIYAVTLVQAPAVDATTCNTSVSSKDYSQQILPVGGNVATDYSTPLLVKGVTAAKYCLDVFVYRVGGTANTSDQVFVQFDGYVTAGSYTAAHVKARTAMLPSDGKIRAPK